jgi:type IV pilus assembly protein PilC
MKFRVSITKEDGKTEERIVDAPSRLDVYKLVEQEGAKVRSIADGSGGSLPGWLTVSIGRPVRRSELVVFAKNLAAMLAAGLSLARSLSVIERQSGNPRLRKIVAALEESVRSGSSFHEALALHANVFPDLFIAMAKAGEESGALASSLSTVGMQMEKSESLSRKIKGAMIYPAIVLSAVLVVGILMMIYVVPTLVATFESLGAAVPLATRVIIAISNFIVGNIALIIIALVALIVLAVFVLRSRGGKNALATIALYLPVIGELVRETYTARTARTLSSLLSAGVPVLEALSITREVVAVPAFARVISEAEENVRKGASMSVAFVNHPRVYPILMSDMAAVGEETGKSAEMLAQVAAFYEEDVEERTKDLSTIIEPAMVLIIGAAVGVFAVAMIAPIYALSSAY